MTDLKIKLPNTKRNKNSKGQTKPHLLIQNVEGNESVANSYSNESIAIDGAKKKFVSLKEEVESSLEDGKSNPEEDGEGITSEDVLMLNGIEHSIDIVGRNITSDEVNEYCEENDETKRCLGEHNCIEPVEEDTKSCDDKHFYMKDTVVYLPKDKKFFLVGISSIYTSERQLSPEDKSESTMTTQQCSQSECDECQEKEMQCLSSDSSETEKKLFLPSISEPVSLEDDIAKKSDIDPTLARKTMKRTSTEEPIVIYDEPIGRYSRTIDILFTLAVITSVTAVPLLLMQIVFPNFFAALVLTPAILLLIPYITIMVGVGLRIASFFGCRTWGNIMRRIHGHGYVYRPGEDDELVK